MTTARIPQAKSAAYRAAVHIHRTGPIPRAELLSLIRFADMPNKSVQMLDRAIASGWLVEGPKGITVGDILRNHLDDLGLANKPKYVGQAATSREALTPLYERPALSKRFIPSSRGTRDDVPAYSVRDQVSFRTVGGQP